jgi:predicted RNA-binding protein (virulence factor B family)
VFQPLKKVQQIDGFIKKVRDDRKIDLCLHEPGYRKVNALSKKILEKLKDRGGFIAVTDESPPEPIAGLFGASKKTYKKAIGHLYKKRSITIEADGIRLCGKLSGTG